MTANTSASHAMARPQHPALAIASWIPIVVFAGALAAFVIYMIIQGPALSAAAQRQQAEQIDQENRVLCQKLGMGFGSDAFASCVGTLAEVRRRHDERLNTGVGIFF